MIYFVGVLAWSAATLALLVLSLKLREGHFLEGYVGEAYSQLASLEGFSILNLTWVLCIVLVQDA